MLMMSLVGPMVFDLDAHWLQEQGYLAQATLEVRTLDYTSPTSRKYNWQEARKELLVDNTDRTVTIAQDIAMAVNEPGTRLLVLTANSVELAENLMEEVEALTRPLKRKLGFSPVVMVSGQSNSKKVSKAFNDLRKGNIRAVITTKIADEGIDVPNINLLYLVGGGKAYVATVQRIGRGLRVKEGGEPLLVVDYFTRGNKYLEKHDKRRLKTYEEENFFSEIVIQDA
jgi:superfamily II DNA or RNA helicase